MSRDASTTADDFRWRYGDWHVRGLPIVDSVTVEGDDVVVVLVIDDYRLRLEARRRYGDQVRFKIALYIHGAAAKDDDAG